MFYLYEKRETGEVTYYDGPQGISLFGRNVGYIPKLLRQKMQKTPPDHYEPYEWHVRVSDELCALGQPGRCIVIDVEPKSKTEVCLYELTDVWGYSGWEWTPMLMRLRDLHMDAKTDRAALEVPRALQEEPIFAMLWTRGTVKNGEIIGKWNPPGPSPTNSVLLWPGTLRYFLEAIQQSDPKVLEGLSFLSSQSRIQK